MIRAALLIALLAATPAADRIPDAVSAGPPRSCIPLAGIRETRVRSDAVIDFFMRGGDTYRVTLPTACSRLWFERRFIYETSQSQLCQQDTIAVLSNYPVARNASCGLAPFQPVTLGKEAR